MQTGPKSCHGPHGLFQDARYLLGFVWLHGPCSVGPHGSAFSFSFLASNKLVSTDIYGLLSGKKNQIKHSILCVSSMFWGFLAGIQISECIKPCVRTSKINKETVIFQTMQCSFPILTKSPQPSVPGDYYSGNVFGGNYNFHKNSYKSQQKNCLNSPKKHICRWYDDTQFYKISCPNSTSFVRYKNNNFQDRKLFRWFVRNLLFLYLTNKVEFGQDIL